MKLSQALDVLWTLVVVIGLVSWAIWEFDPFGDNSIKILRYRNSVETESGYARVYNESHFKINQNAQSVVQIVKSPIFDERLKLDAASAIISGNNETIPVSQKVLNEVNTLFHTSYENIYTLKDCKIFSNENWICNDSILGAHSDNIQSVTAMQDNVWLFHHQTPINTEGHWRWKTAWTISKFLDGNVSFLISREDWELKLIEAQKILDRAVQRTK